MGKKCFTLSNKAFAIALLIGLLLPFANNAGAQGTSRKMTDDQVTSVMTSGNANISFIENKGQWPGHVLFRADIHGAQMLATPQGMMVGAYDPATLSAAAAYETQVEEIQKGLTPGVTVKDLGPAPILKGHGWRFNFVGGNLATSQSISKKGESADYYNYLIGDESSHATNVHSYSELTYKNVYEGVDVKYYTSARGELENDIIVKPGTNASQIKIQIEGIEDLKLNDKGDIIMPTTVGDMVVPSPQSYLLDKDGKKTEVKITYKLTGKNTLTFNIPAYDNSQTLVIDPIVMRWATMVSNNESSDSHCHGIDVDASGNIYVTGKYVNGLITVGAFQTATDGGYDLFIGKYQEPVTPGGSGTRVWQTYLGSTNTDNPYALDAGPDGNIYIASVTNGNLNKTYGTGFTAGTWTQRTIVGGGQQVFIAKINGAGTGALVRELGSVSANLNPYLFDLRLISTGSGTFDLIATGYVNQQSGTAADGDVPPPVTPAGTALTTGSGHINGYILRITSDLATIKWSEQYGTGSTTNEFNIAVVDNSGNLLVGGLTNSANNISFNNPSGQTAIGGSQDGWLLSLNATSGATNWSRYFNSGSGKTSTILCMEVNTQQTQVFLGGITTGLGAVNVTSGAYQTAYGGGNHDFFVASLPVSGAATTWGTYFGGNGDESNMMGLNVDQNNDVYVLGYSVSKNIPTATNPIQTNSYDGTNSDAIFFKLTGSTGATLQYSTYLGGTDNETDPVGERGIRFNNCRIYLAITTNSNNFPLTQGTITPNRLSGTGSGEPILVSMANPPDLTDNGITSGANQSLTCGQTPQPITAGVPAYVIPNIIRNQVVETNGTAAAYPSGVPTITSYQWQYSTNGGVTWVSIAGATGQNYTPTVIDSFIGTFKFRRIIDNDACNLASDTLAVVTITVTPPYAAPAITTNSPLCAGQTLDLGTPAQSGFTYAWSGPNNFSSTTENPTIANVTTAAAGSYKLIITNSSNGCPSYPDSSTVVINSALPAPGASSNSPVCSGGTIDLFATGTGSTFSWTGPNGYTSSAQNPTILNAGTSNAGTYLVTQSNGGTCTSAAAQVSVAVSALPAPTGVTATTPLCSGTGNTLTLTATALTGDTLKWTFPDGGTATGSPVTRTNVTTAMAGNYIVVQKNSTGCTSAADTVKVTINQTPVAPTVSPLTDTLCTGANLTLTATGTSGATFTWTTPAGAHPTNNPLIITNVTTAAAGTYSATQTVNGCTSPSSTNATVVVNPTPVISGVTGVNPDACNINDGSLTIAGLTSGKTYAVTYNFNSTAVGPVSIVANGSGQVIINNLAAGTYSNIIVTLSGCPSAPFSGSVTLSTPTSPLAPTVGNNGPVCTGNPLTLTATGQSGATFIWSNTTTGYSTTTTSTTVTVSNTATLAMGTGSYCATQTVAGCVSPSACTTVTVNQTPAITTTTTTNPTTCGGTNGSITLNGLTAGVTYAVTYTAGSTAVGPVSIVANGTGQVIITGLNAGSYTNFVVKASGCTSAPVAGPIVISNPITPAAPTVNSNTPVCAGGTINLTASGQLSATFSWTGPTGSGYTSSAQNPSITNAATTQSGSYCATQTLNNCTSPSACTPVTVNPTPVISGSSSTNPTSCGGSDGSISLNGLIAGKTYVVTYIFDTTSVGPLTIVANGSGQVIINGLSAGSYTGIVVSLGGCPSAPLNGTITLSNPTIPSAPIAGSNSPVCSGNPLTLSASGQSGATFAWTGPNTYTSNVANPTVSASATSTLNGSYCVTQTVAGCKSPSACVNVTVNPTPTASAGPAGGFKVCNGSSIIIGGTPTANGGTSPYTYAWSGGASSIANPTVAPTINSSYFVTVTDHNLCSAVASTNVTVNPAPTANAGPNVSMPGCDTVGVIIGGTPTGTGGTAPLTYSWSPAAGLITDTSARPRVKGIGDTTLYTVTVTDANGCSATSSVQVSITSSTLSASITVNPSATWCAGSNSSATLTVNPIGGTPNYTYLWSGKHLSTTNTISTTANPDTAGVYSYSVVVTDAAGCQAGATAKVTVNPTPTVNAGSGTGYTICNGTSVTLGGNPTASGGTAPYSYAWSGSLAADSSPVATPTSTSTYTVTVTDHNNCSATSSTTVNVNQNPIADAGTTKTLPTCSPTGVQIGGTPTAKSGSAPYSYSWSPNLDLFTNTIANPQVIGLTHDTIYTVVVTDSNGCSASAQVAVNVVNATPAVVITPSTTPEWCSGSGSSTNLTANVSKGTGTFSYSWQGTAISPTNAATATVDPTVAGSYVYTVTVTDAANCTATGTETVIVDSLPRANAGGAQTLCSGFSVTLGGAPTAAGGNPPYHYAWSNGATTANPVVSPTTTTVYTLTVTDSTGCTATANANITVRTTPVASAGTSPVTLPGCSPTGIQIGGSPTASGGSGGPFTYAWSPKHGLNDSTIANPTVTGLVANTVYTVTVTDISGCTATAQVTVNVTNTPPTVTITSSGGGSWCAGGNTTSILTASVAGGSTPFRYNWTGVDISPTNGASASVNPSVAGSYVYTVVVTDGFNCTATAKDTITVDSIPRANSGGGTSKEFTTCGGSPVTLGGSPTASGGVAPYTYSWNPTSGLANADSANPVATPTSTTTYTVTVTDSKGCTATSTSTVVVRTNPVASAGNPQTLPTCSPTGITIGGTPTASGGSGGAYKYKWTPNTDLFNDSIANPQVIGLTTNTVYTVLVTDTNGCTATSSVSITVSHTVPTVSISASGPTEYCANTNTSVNLTATVGGTTGSIYLWSGTDISPINSSVVTVNPNVAGSYTYNVTVTDVSGCTATGSKVIKVDSLPTANAGTSGFAICDGRSVIIGGNPTATGGTKPYTYAWSGNAAPDSMPTVSPQVTATYIVTVTDANGCKATAATTVNVRPTPTADAGPDQNITTCSGDSVTLGGSPSAYGGTTPYHYSWSPAYGLNDSTTANPVVKGITSSQTYILLVTDSNGCTGLDNVVIHVVPSTLQANISNTKTTCGGTNSCVQLGGLPSVFGGTGPYVFSWSNQASLDNPASSNPVACPDSTTTYTVTITDSKGCSVTASQTVVINAPPVANAGNDTSVCQGSSIQIGGVPTATGGVAPYTYSWSPSTGLSAPNIARPYASPTIITTYELTVTDNKGCTATAGITVTPNTNPVVNAGPDKTITSCIGDTAVLGGMPDVTSGGTPPYIYHWTPGTDLSDTAAASPYVTGLTATTSYELIVTDSNGCKGTDFIVVNVVSSTLQASTANNQIICGSFASPVQIGGSPTASGGTGPYTYNWSPTNGLNPGGATTSNPTALPAHTTTYHVTVTDAKGCTSVDSVTVTVHPAPTATAGNDTVICSGFGVVLGGNPTAAGGTPGYKYTWNPATGLSANNIANPTAFTTVTETYNLTVTDTVGCQAVASVTVFVNPKPAANAGPDVSLSTCASDSVRLGGTPAATGGTPAYTYVWGPASGLSNDSIANPWLHGITATTIYALTVTDANGCTATDQTLVTVTQSTLTASAGNGGAYCQGTGTGITIGGTPTANGGTPVYTYTWLPATGLNNPNIANPVADPTVTTEYHLTVTDAKGCIAVDSVLITVYPAMTVHAGTDTTVCNGITVQLGSAPTVSGGYPPYHYAWSPAIGLSSSTASNPYATPTANTTYTVTVTGRTGCTATGSVTVNVHQDPTANAGTGGTLVSCAADSLQLGGFPAASNGTPPYTYVWSANAGLSCDSCPNPYVSHLASSAVYTLVVTDSNHCTASSQVNVTVKGSGLTADAGNPATFCQGTAISYRLGGSPTASDGSTAIASYSWTPNNGTLSSTTSANPNASPTVTTVYHVVVTDVNGCIATDSVKITVNPSPVASAGANDTICVGSTVVLGGSPTAASGSGSTYTYAWNPGLYFVSSATIANPTVQPTANVIYTVTVTDSLGCSATSSVSVTVHQNPTANAGGPQTVVACPLACITLGYSPTANNGTPPYKYAWSPKNANINNTGLANPMVCNLSAPVTYQVTVTDSFGCSATSSATISVTQSTLAANAGPDQKICQGQSTGVTLGGSPAASGGTGPYLYDWNPAAGITTSTSIANPTANPTDTTTYVLLVQDAYGCIALDSVNIYVDPAVTASVHNDTFVCAGGTVAIGGDTTGGGGTKPYTYLWSPGTGLSSTTTGNPNATPSSTSTYCVTVTDAAHCSASACQTVTVNPAVLACAGPVGGFTMTNCPGSFVKIGCTPTATGGSGNYSYTWSPDSVNGVQVLNGSTVPNPIVTNLSQTTLFTVTVTDNATGCTGTAQVNVNVNQSTLQAHAGNDQTLCGGSTTCLNIGGQATGGFPPYQYAWAPIAGVNDPTIATPCVTPTVTTDYIVTVTDRLGCNAFDTVVITVNPQITVIAGDDTSICSGQSVVLGGNPEFFGGTGPYTYSWTPTNNLSNNTAPYPTAQNLTSNITYTLMITDSLHCSATGSVSINVRLLPTANAGPPASIYPCSGDSATLGGNPTASGTTGPYTYSWTPPFTMALNCLTCPNPIVKELGHTTQFCVTVTDTFGCQATNCANVTVLPNTVFANATPPSLSTLCANVPGGCVTLGGSPAASGGVPGYTYSWTGGVLADSVIAHPQACPTASTTYTLVVTDSKGCQAADSVTVIVNKPPVVLVTGLNPQYCVNAGNVTITGTPTGGTFSGPGVTGNVFQPSVVGPGTWCIKYAYTDPTTGCVGDTTICVKVNPLPVVSITGYSNTGYCSSDTAAPLTGTPAGGVFSGKGIVGNSFYPDSAAIGNNTITYTYTDTTTGCSNSTQVVINVKGSPTLSVAVSTDTVCAGQTVQLTPTYSFDVFNIQWSVEGGANLTSSLNTITVSPTGTHYCVIAAAANSAGCITRDTTCMDVWPAPVITDPLIINTCENQPDTFNVLSKVIDPQGHTDVVTILVPPLHGTMVSTGNGVYIYTPPPYYHGQDSFKFSACNSACSNTCDTGTDYINICYVPYPPVIIDTTITIYENDTAHVCPQIFDYNNLPLVIGNAGCDSLIGQLVFTSDSCFEYIPTIGFVGTQTLCITVCDTAGLCDTGTVIIHVVPINKAPLAFPVQVYTCTSTPIGVNVAAATVDPDGNPLTYTYGVGTGPGTYTFVTTGNGAQVFVASAPGIYTIPYTVCNHSPIPVYSLCASSTITVTVIACDTVPHTDSIAANNDGAVTHVGVPVVINELANDYYPNPDSLTVTILSGPDLSGATATIDSNGQISYTSNTPGIDTIVYQICDPAPLCATASIIIYVDTIPGTIIYPPVAVNDFDSTGYQTSVTVPVLNNDHGPSGDTLYVTGVISGPDNGTTVVNPNGTITYTPDSATTTQHPDTFVYRVCEVLHPAECDTATVVVYIKPDLPPAAFPQHIYTCVKTATGVNVAASTSTPYGQPLTYTYGAITGGAATWVTTSPGAQVFVANTPGTYTIPYTICAHDPASGGPICVSSLITVTVIACDTVPHTDSIAANNDGLVTNVGVTNTVNELANDYYPNDTALTVTIVHGPDLTGATATINPNGTINYQSPTPGQDTIEYQICDPAPLCATAFIIITVDTTPTNINVPPVAVNDYDSTGYQTPVTVPVLNNDYSPSGDSIYVTSVVSGPNNGTTVVNPNGTITYTPDSTTTTQHPDTFVYQICEVAHPTICDTASVVVYIKPDLPPSAFPQHVYTCVNAAIGVNVSASTNTPYGQPLSFSYGTVSGPGTATWLTTSPGAQVFVANTPGTYTIPYTICAHDPASGGPICVSSLITVTVINCGTTPNDSIAANNDGLVTNVGDTSVINEFANDYYPNDTALTVTIVHGPDLTGATATINPNGTINYQSPTPGQDTIEYQICDPAPLCATAFIIITVDTTPTNINVPPVAVNDYDSTNYQTPVTVPVLSNDYSPSGDSIHVTTVISGPDNGTTVVNPNGTITYTPDSNVTAQHPDTFVYQICENQHPTLCDTATVVVYIRTNDAPPIAFPQKVYTCVNTAIGVNVAASTSDPHGYPLTYTYGTITGPGTHSWVTTSNGAQVFVGSRPGTYTIPYTVCNHDPATTAVLCASSVITVVVISCDTTPNDSIAANNDGAITNVGDTIVINQLANDYYPTPDSLTVTIVSGPDLTGATAVINPNGTITYNSPTPGTDTIQYQICDPSPLCATAIIVITVDSTPANINYPPVAVNDYDSTNYETTVIVPVLNNDHAPSGDSIHVTGVVSGPNNGTTVVNPNGTISYTPDSAVTPLHPDTFVYQICEIQHPTECDTATVVVYIRAKDLPPLAFPQKVYTCIKTPIGVDVAASTSDPQGYPLTYTYGTVSGPDTSTWITTGNGAQVFVAKTAGTYTVTYTVCNLSPLDGSKLCASNTITVVVVNCSTNPNDSIAANNDGVITNIRTNTVINELGNDYYPNPDSLTVTILTGPDLPGATAVINPNGTITYSSPVTGMDTIEYQICDPAPLCATAYIIITVDSVPAHIVYPPVAVNDFDSTNYETAVTIPVLDNDYNLSGDSFHVTTIPCQPDKGTAVLNANGTITYTPGWMANALRPDTFCYQICDVAYPGLCDTAQVVVYIRPSVAAINDTTSTGQHNPTVINVLSNDTTPEHVPIIVVHVITTGTVGTVTIDSSGMITYTPKPDTCGFIDSFRYVDSTTLGAKDTATVYITVACCPTPIAIADSVSLQQGDTLVFNPFHNDLDSGATLSGEVLVAPTHGVAHFINDSVMVYVPNAGYCGIDHMEYEGKGPCGVDTATITLNVICRTAPVAGNDTVNACKTTPININVFLKDSVEVGLTLSLTNVGTPAPSSLGSVTGINGGIITFTPNGITGTASMLYTVCDNGTPALCKSGTIVINIGNCQNPTVDTIYDTTFINTPGTACIGRYVNAGGNAWHIDSLCNPMNGTDSIVGPGDSCLVYIPNNNYTGNDTFCIVVCDTFGCVTSQVIYTVIDTTIKANPIYCDVDTTVMNLPDTLNVLAYDTIPKAGDTVITITTNPVNGKVSVNGNNTVTYVPNNDYKGTDEFIYEVCAVTGSYKYCDTASVCITIIDTSHHCIIPDGFSPNGDGVNDVYVIPCNDNYPLATLKVYSRWGDEVWNSNGPYANNWDGKNEEGTVCPTGTYYIIYDYNDGVTKSIAKFVVINR